MLCRQVFSPAQLQIHAKRHLNVSFRRYLRSSLQQHAFVGPPDPVSNLRPVIYDEVDSTQSGRRRKGKDTDRDVESEAGAPGSSGILSVAKRTRTSPTHPYLLDEFNGDPLDYQWRVERNRLDAYNHAFWKDSNTRFEDAKHSVLSSLPESSPPEAREAALSEFYGKWLKQEQDRLKEYSDDWSRRNFGGIMLAARAAIRQFRSRIFGDSTTRLHSTPQMPPQTSDQPRK